MESIYQNDAHYVAIDHAELDSKKLPEKFETLTHLFNSQTNSEVYMADLCLPLDIILGLLARGNKVTILDHHASSQPTIDALKTLNHPNCTISFNEENTQSGALVTWNFAHPNTPPPKAVRLVSDGDTWTFEFGDETRHFYAGINKDLPPGRLPPSFFLDLVNGGESVVNDHIQTGATLYSAYVKEMLSYADKAQKIEINGDIGYWVEAPAKYKSDLGNHLAKQGGTFGIVVEDKRDTFSVSLRSVAPYRVDTIAAQWDGGGHQQASAFRLNNREAWNTLVQSHQPSLKRKFPN